MQEPQLKPEQEQQVALAATKPDELQLQQQQQPIAESVSVSHADGRRHKSSHSTDEIHFWQVKVACGFSVLVAVVGCQSNMSNDCTQ